LFLEATLDSVAQQSYTELECLVIDDGSTDASASLVLAYAAKDERFRLIRTANKGVSHARNTGIRQAQGAFIQFLDSDDLLGIDKLQHCIRYYAAHPEADIAYNGARYFHTASPEKLMVHGRNYLTGVTELTVHDTDVLRSVFLRNPFVTSAPLYKRSVFTIAGVYDESFQYLEDWDFQIRCAAAGLRFQYLGYEPLTATFIRLHTSSLMNHRKAILAAKQQLAAKHAAIDTEGILGQHSMRSLTRIQKFKKIFYSFYK
jgi:glycosyltransferase involved in cell wall biosynthesis